MGAGWGSVGVTCDVCPDERAGGFGGFAAAGGTVSPRVALGAEASVWFNTDEDFQERMTFVSLVGVFFLQREAGLYLKAGVGGMWYLGETLIEDFTATAPAFLFGTGYEFSIGSGWYVVPFLTVLTTTNAKFELAGVPQSGDNPIRIDMFKFGFGFTHP